MSFSTEELISVTKPVFSKEGFVRKNERLLTIIGTLSYLVKNKVSLDEIKDMIIEIDYIVENS